MSVLRAPIKAISLDVTGTIIAHRYPIFETYATAAVWARLPNPPTAEELKPAFKQAYFDALTSRPNFGGTSQSPRNWWVETVKAALANCGRAHYSEEEFNRFFRRVYQHYGCTEGYIELPDAKPFVEWAKGRGITMGVTTNTPYRTMDTVIPMMGFHEYFNWFSCSQEVGEEKPHQKIFDEAHKQAQFWVPGIRREEILHIGDSLEADLCGAKAAGFQSVLLDRSQSAVKVTKYQDWLKGPDYEGKSEDDIRRCTVQDLGQVRHMIEQAFGK